MFRKIAIAALISGFTVASFAQAGASTTAKPATPAATEQKAETPAPAKHVKKHRHHKKAAAKADTAAPAASAK